jgi:hypothetical protein
VSKIKTSLFRLLVAGLFISSAIASEQVSPLQMVEGVEKLEKIEHSVFSEAYVKPGVDFSVYSSIYIADFLFQYRDVEPLENAEDIKGTFSFTTDKKEFPLSEDERSEFEKIVESTFRKVISKGKHYDLVDASEADQHTLILRGVVADIVSRAPPESVGQIVSYQTNLGGAVLGLEILDGESGEVLGRIVDRKQIGRTRGRSTSARRVSRSTVIKGIEGWADTVARKLRTALNNGLK